MRDGYIVRRPHTEDKAFDTFNKAKASLVELVAKQRKQFYSLNDTEGLVACGAALEDIERIPPHGGSVNRVIDPPSGLRFQAEVIKR